MLREKDETIGRSVLGESLKSKMRMHDKPRDFGHLYYEKRHWSM